MFHIPTDATVSCATIRLSLSAKKRSSSFIMNLYILQRRVNFKYPFQDTPRSIENHGLSFAHAFGKVLYGGPLGSFLNIFTKFFFLVLLCFKSLFQFVLSFFLLSLTFCKIIVIRK